MWFLEGPSHYDLWYGTTKTYKNRSNVQNKLSLNWQMTRLYNVRNIGKIPETNLTRWDDQFPLPMNPQSMEQGPFADKKTRQKKKKEKKEKRWILWQHHNTPILRSVHVQKRSIFAYNGSLYPLMPWFSQCRTLIGFWRQTVRLLDVMWLWTSQLMRALWRGKLSYMQERMILSRHMSITFLVNFSIMIF